MAVFDLLTLLARQIAVDSLGEHRASFTRVLAKTLSVVIQCNCNMSAAESKLSRIGLGVTSVIEDLAQSNVKSKLKSFLSVDIFAQHS